MAVSREVKDHQDLVNPSGPFDLPGLLIATLAQSNELVTARGTETFRIRRVFWPIERKGMKAASLPP